MQLGMIGLGRMGGDMVRRLLEKGHECVVFDRSSEAVAALREEGAVGAGTLEEFFARLAKPRSVWLMVPAAVVDDALDGLLPYLEPGDVVIDGGNSYYHDDIRRAEKMRSREVAYLDVGTSGGVRGRKRGYCLMIGGEKEPVARLDPIFAALAPGVEAATPTPGRRPGEGTAPATLSRWCTTALNTA